MKILIVDDMPTVQKLLNMQLKKMGFQDVTAASNGAEAWSLIENAAPPFQLIISDWNMPVCNGFDLLKRVRAVQATKELPFYMLTAEAEAHDIKSAMAAGVTGYLVKPVTIDTLAEKFKKYLE